jgi:hypothetical protein
MGTSEKPSPRKADEKLGLWVDHYVMSRHLNQPSHLLWLNQQRAFYADRPLFTASPLRLVRPDKVTSVKVFKKRGK